MFGTSRATCHVDPERVGATLGRSVYNAGGNGQRIAYGRMLFHLMIDAGFDGPLVLLQAEPRGLFKPEFQRVKFMALFARNNALVFDTLQSLDPHFRVKMLSAVYPFNSTLPTLLLHMGANHRAISTPHAKGNSRSRRPSDWFELDLPAVDAPDLRAMDLIMSLCRSARDVFMFTGPYRDGGVTHATGSHKSSSRTWPQRTRASCTKR